MNFLIYLSIEIATAEYSGCDSSTINLSTFPECLRLKVVGSQLGFPTHVFTHEAEYGLNPT